MAMASVVSVASRPRGSRTRRARSRSSSWPVAPPAGSPTHHPPAIAAAHCIPSRRDCRAVVALDSSTMATWTPAVSRSSTSPMPTPSGGCRHAPIPGSTIGPATTGRTPTAARRRSASTGSSRRRDGSAPRPATRPAREPVPRRPRRAGRDPFVPPGQAARRRTPSSRADPGPTTRSPRRRRSVARSPTMRRASCACSGAGSAWSASYAKVLLLDEVAAAYCQFGPLTAYPRAQRTRDLYPALPASPCPPSSRASPRPARPGRRRRPRPGRGGLRRPRRPWLRRGRDVPGDRRATGRDERGDTRVLGVGRVRRRGRRRALPGHAPRARVTGCPGVARRHSSGRPGAGHRRHRVHPRPGHPGARVRRTAAEPDRHDARRARRRRHRRRWRSIPRCSICCPPTSMASPSARTPATAEVAADASLAPFIDGLAIADRFGPIATDTAVDYVVVTVARLAPGHVRGPVLPRLAGHVRRGGAAPRPAGWTVTPRPTSATIGRTSGRVPGAFGPTTSTCGERRDRIDAVGRPRAVRRAHRGRPDRVACRP